MRIVAGTARGRRLTTLEGTATRPTGDRVREALFSMLGNINGTIVVDAFAGSGALGCEALSRGAERCFFFDNSRPAIEVIRENLETIGKTQSADIKKCTFEYGLAHYIQDEVDLWFLDPPYESNLAEKALIAMAQSPYVTQGALVVLETGSKSELPQATGFSLEDNRRYGTTRLVFYRRLATDPSATDQSEEPDDELSPYK